VSRAIEPGKAAVSRPTESRTHALRNLGTRLPPAVLALLIQTVACLLSFLTLAFTGWPQANPILFALLQGSLAAVLSHKASQAPWWPPIQFAFPVAAVLVQTLSLPPVLFFIVFLLLLGVFWSTFRTQVPYYPSSKPVRDAVAALLPAAPVRFIDIGSGLGGLTLELARRRTESSFFGIEIAPLPWLLSMLRAKLLRNDARFLLGDYNGLDFSRYDVIFAYLSPAAMPALWDKARAEMRPGALLLSYEFLIPQAAPDISGSPDGQGRSLYGWRM
jgi:SAM-dependent methyltransferase